MARLSYLHGEQIPFSRADHRREINLHLQLFAKQPGRILVLAASLTCGQGRHNLERYINSSESEVLSEKSTRAVVRERQAKAYVL